MSIDSSKPTGRQNGLILTVAAISMLAFGFIVWWLWPMEFGMGGDYTMEGVVVQLRAWGPWAALGSIVLMVVHSFLPFPSEIITLANGMVFGPFWGSVITWVGAMLGAVSTFGLVRLLGRPFVYRMLSDSQLLRLTDWSSRQGGIALLIGRLIPVLAFNLLNYAAAMTHISWWTYIWTTGLGILPMTILLNVFGASVLTMTTSSWIWLLSILAATLGAIVLWRRSRGNGCKK